VKITVFKGQGYYNNICTLC